MNFIDNFTVFALSVIQSKEQNQQLVNQKVCHVLKVLSYCLDGSKETSGYRALSG